jgi:AcrR family transcriptional regulator
MARGTQKQPKPPAGEARWTARKEEILTEAARLFAQRGYSETDTQLLAETIGVGKGTVYRYFPSKRELFLAAADRVMRMMRERVNQRVDGIVDPLARITRSMHEFLLFFAEHPEFVELLIQERALFKDRRRPTFIEHRLLNLERWQDMYRGLIADGRVRHIPPEGITDVVGNLLYGTIFMNYFSGQTASPETQARNITNILLNGILTDEERAVQHAEAEPAAAALPRDASLD